MSKEYYTADDEMPNCMACANADLGGCETYCGPSNSYGLYRRIEYSHQESLNENHFEETNNSIKKESEILERERLNVLLFNAIDLLLNENYTRAQIMEELGMTKEEFEAVGENLK